jgi:hypothetical protein
MVMDARVKPEHDEWGRDARVKPEHDAWGRYR